ncbi:diacylglycerol kinase [Nitrosococcus halophilus Nc 4]|uniref:Diacylglycerol kinase n=1 Tax=Nitrosococcus halophilus (strain Nc4) TaxID=472759 RepID=D5C2M7_NITHN|nr:diacylglycerol kinase [Nitrosococcus halophilus]ADE16702.1 diacylglycerol kinase [Nitrosococcus halophilus Nc 4]
MTKQIHPKDEGLRHLFLAAGYSFKGFRAALSETAFRQELLLLLVGGPLGLWLGETGIERALLVGSLLLVLIVELLNTAVEAAVDRVGYEHHTLSGRAKDLGSAAVFTSLALAAFVWFSILL